MENKLEEREEIKQRVREIVGPDKALPDTGKIDLPVPPPPAQPVIYCGYYVGVGDDGIIRFDIVGSQQNITSLLGLHQVAGEKIQSLVDRYQGGKFSYIAKQMKQLEGKLDQLHEIIRTIEQLTAAVITTKGAGTEDSSKLQ